jgi:hypothetical protein
MILPPLVFPGLGRSQLIQRKVTQDQNYSLWRHIDIVLESAYRSLWRDEFKILLLEKVN